MQDDGWRFGRKPKHPSVTVVDVLQRPGGDAFFEATALLSAFHFSAAVRDFSEQLNRRIRNLIWRVLFQLVRYQGHVSADDLDERSSKKISFTDKSGTDRENDA